jgi:hypothetical protein
LGEQKIVGVTIKIANDDDQLLYDEIGCFNRDSTSKFAVNHWRRGGDVRRELEWFNPAGAGSRADAERDYLLIMDMYRNDRSFISIRAVARISENPGDAETDEIDTGSIGGVLDDDKASISQVKRSVLSELEELLKKEGFSAKEITEAIKNVEDEYD